MKQIQFMKQQIFSHIKEQLSLYTFVIILLCIGIFFGAILVNSLEFTQKQDLYFYLSRFFGQVAENKIASGKDMFILSYASHLKMMGLLWILGISIIGIPIIIFLLFLKGITVGFTVGLLVSQFGFKGFFIALGTILPQNIIVLPAMMVMVVLGINFSTQMIRNQFRTRKVTPFGTMILAYSVIFLVMACVFIVPSWYEAFISPTLMKQIVQFVVK